MRKSMIRAKRFLLCIASSFLLLTCIAFSASAQKPRPTPNPRDQILTRPNDRVRIPTEAISVIPPFSVRGKIRWRKAYGVIPTGPATRDPSPLPCGHFFVAAMKMGPAAPGSLGGRLTTVATTPNLPNKITQGPDEGDYYVCNYIIPDLPKDTNLVILAGMGGTLLLPQMDRDPYYWRNPWIGGSQPQPPPGYERVFKGGQNVTLTNNLSRMSIDFEMIYGPVAQDPR
jgi:hypothetical protein